MACTDASAPCGSAADAASGTDRLRQCEQHFQATHDPRSAAAASDLLRRRGRLAWDDSRYGEALDAMDQAVRYAEAAGDQSARSKAMRGMFTLLLEMGDLTGAGRLLDEIRRAKAVLDARTRVLLTFDEGLLEEAKDQPHSALSAFEAVLASPALAQVPELDWTATMNLLALSLRANDVPRARQYADQVDRLFAAGPYKQRAKSRVARGHYRAQLALLEGQPDQALAIVDALASDKPAAQMAWKLAFERGRAQQALGQPEARADFEKAITIIEGMRKVEFDDFKSWIIAARLAPYRALFDWHRTRGDATAALDVVERMQGRTFLDALGSAAQVTAGQRPRDAVVRLEWLRRFYPALRASPVLGEAAPVETLLRTLADVHLLVFFETSASLFLIQAHGRRVQLVQAPGSLPEIRRRLAGLLNTKGADRPDHDASATLAAALFPAALKLGPPGATLHVVLSPSLARLPLAALTHRGQPVVQRFAIVHVPSLTALAALRTRPRGASDVAVVMGDAQSDLPAAAHEVAEVQQWLSQQGPSRLDVGAGASASRLLDAKAARVIHLALHSDVGPGGPTLRLHDRSVSAGDILDAGIATDLAVLATCASGVSFDPGLWGSLVAAFLAGGAASVLGTLWAVDDTSSRAFILDFYRAGGAADPAGSLARVQRTWMMRQRPLTDWGGFVLFGQPHR